ncbi:flavodoxin family protein [Nonomuraea sp. NPDC049028]|uniref:flavodoxin family protein n=1 Tax=Nonomuraea sp. NPDC049028 TaxID=3364348 RepID=UPI00371516FC
MYALIVYESMFGNTKQIAEAVAEGLATTMRTEVLEVGSAPASVGEDLGLLVVGGPTHAFGMSRASTRQSAAQQGRVLSQGQGVREWLATVRSPSARLASAAFDTRIAKPRAVSPSDCVGSAWPWPRPPRASTSPELRGRWWSARWSGPGNGAGTSPRPSLSRRPETVMEPRADRCVLEVRKPGACATSGRRNPKEDDDEQSDRGRRGRIAIGRIGARLGRR